MASKPTVRTTTTPNPTKPQQKNAFDLLTAKKLEYKDVNESTNLLDYSADQRLSLFEEFVNVIAGPNSKTKKENRIISKIMFDMLVSMNKKCKDQEKEIKMLKEKVNVNQDRQAIVPAIITGNPRSFNSYADCVINKEKENLIIIKKNNVNDNANLKDLVFKHLNPIKREIEFKKIRNRKYTLILDTCNESQQAKVIESLQTIKTITCKKPKKLIPSLLIKDIERQADISDYKEYIIDELAEDLQIDRKEINVKAIINNAKFKTIRCIVNLDFENTNKVLNRGYVKIGFVSCKTERTFKVFCCRDCFRFDHKTEDCKTGKLCGLCSSNHSKDEECPAKLDKSKMKCVNCNGNHPSFSAHCLERIELLNKLLDRSSCQINVQKTRINVIQK